MSVITAITMMIAMICAYLFLFLSSPRSPCYGMIQAWKDGNIRQHTASMSPTDPLSDLSGKILPLTLGPTNASRGWREHSALLLVTASCAFLINFSNFLDQFLASHSLHSLRYGVGLSKLGEKGGKVCSEKKKMFLPGKLSFLEKLS